MMSDEADELISRVAEALKPLPAVDENAKAAVLVAVAAERERERQEARVRRTTGSRWWLATTVVLAASMIVSVVWVRASRSTPPLVAAADGARGTAPVGTAALASRGALDAGAAQPVQLVFRAPAATRVSVVGDFTGWDAGAAAMTQDPASGLWSVTLFVRPGRHVYAFLVDDSIWVRDPRAPIAADADFQRPGSLLLVGRP
jgi:hypothetical protein